jgi:hypothetical protein
MEFFGVLNLPNATHPLTKHDVVIKIEFAILPRFLVGSIGVPHFPSRSV